MVAGPFKGIKIQGIILFSIPGCETVDRYGPKELPGRPTCCFPYVSLFLNRTSQDRHLKLTFYLSLWEPLALLPFGWNSLGMFDSSPLGMNGGNVSGPLLLSVFFLLLPAVLSSWGIFALLLSDFMSITFSVCL